MTGLKLFLIPRKTISCLITKDQLPKLSITPDITFVTGELVEAAKALRDFAKDNKQLVIKGGVMDGELLSAEAVDKLASLESREVLLAKAAGAMKASLAKAAHLVGRAHV